MRITVEKAWLEYRARLLSYISSKIPIEDDAEDILSDVFVKLTKEVTTKAVPRNLLSWLNTVTRNSIIDYYRSRKEFDELPSDVIAEQQRSDVMKELSYCLQPMIRTLPKNYRQPLMLLVRGGKRYSEIASELNLTLPALKSRILRGRAKLRISITKCCTVHKNDRDEFVAYEQISNESCFDDCSK